jgi:hypothetical protein
VKKMMGIGGSSSPGVAVQMATDPSLIFGFGPGYETERIPYLQTGSSGGSITITNNSSVQIYVAVGNSSDNINPSEPISSGAKNSPIPAKGSATKSYDDTGGTGKEVHVYVWTDDQTNPVYYISFGATDGSTITSKTQAWWIISAQFTVDSSDEMTLTIKASILYSLIWYVVGFLALIVILLLIKRFLPSKEKP